jgi:Negative regulator of sigma F
VVRAEPAVVLIASEIVYQRPAVGLEVEAQSIPALLLTLLLLVGLSLLSTLAAVWRGATGLGAGATSLALIAGLVVPIYAALVLPHPLHSHDLPIPGVEISPWGLRCFVIATIISVLALVSFAGALRCAVPVASRLRGAALGAAAGAWAGLAVFIFCPSGDQLHLLLGHVAPILAFTLVGALPLSRALRP